MRFAGAVLCLSMALSAGAALAQSPEQAIRQAQDAMIAAQKAGDKAAYQRLYADDLRWIGSDGTIQNKQQRIASITPNPNFDRAFVDAEFKVYGNIATEVARITFTENGQRKADRVLRVFINRNGQWQLLSHAAIANAK